MNQDMDKSVWEHVAMILVMTLVSVGIAMLMARCGININ